MEELKKLIQEEKPLLNQVHQDVASLTGLFVPFMEKMDAFMDNMQRYIDREQPK